MPDAWLPLISSVIGAAVGGTVAMLTARMTNRSNAVRERERYAAEQAKHRTDLLRSRAEELYILFDKWETDLSLYHMSQYSWISGKLTRAQALDMTNKHLPKERTTGRMEMLIHAYFQDVHVTYLSFLASRDNANKVISACSPPTSPTQALARVEAAMDECHRHGKAVRQSILLQLQQL